MPMDLAASMTPRATMSVRTMPPKMLMSTGLAAGQLDDVHRRHREPRAVDHAGDVAVELDVVEVELRRLDLQRLLLVQVAQGVEVRVAEHRVVVEGDLGVEREEAAVLRQEEGVNLQ